VQESSELVAELVLCALQHRVEDVHFALHDGLLVHERVEQGHELLAFREFGGHLVLLKDFHRNGEFLKNRFGHYWSQSMNYSVTTAPPPKKNSKVTLMLRTLTVIKFIQLQILNVNIQHFQIIVNNYDEKVFANTPTNNKGNNIFTPYLHMFQP
jgi:hypothetical protein